jgi:hypothetical protein
VTTLQNDQNLSLYVPAITQEPTKEFRQEYVEEYCEIPSPVPAVKMEPQHTAKSLPPTSLQNCRYRSSTLHHSWLWK